ncbi:uncharacterized protein BP01DRAFT_415769 [Aspergillus saccharolyticus JOP 1030-1]|uniref:CFEM domain-containing protein n=1 Tax=Aspergillus saccharolyticus JOP 1030-1 TaxID=1450539 RepID=A0A318ZFN6_9EURO|nr:hypothetical protein BP01DRAFT_415769 [Aspergillus saccharolyticus JOP 1030-1]PYH45517.1 hypothetical protein BP01DRAFT_415769 [Aspergillus saccharolyticus JOP 1030-1]
MSLLLWSSQNSAPATTASTLSSRIPKCARECVDEFIISDYPDDACGEAWNLDCLCRTNTTSGYTLGEAAFRCSLSLCSVNTIFSSDLYDICDSVPGALPRTHATITATITSTQSTTAVVTTTSDSHSVATTIISMSRPLPTENTKTAHTTSVIITSFDSPTTISDTTQHTSAPWATSSSTTGSGNNSTAAAAAATADSHSKLGAGAVIGISVASGMAGFFLVGVLILFYYRKNKRREAEAQDRNFFEIGGVMTEPPDFAFPPRRPTGPRPMPGGTDRDSETSRLITPFGSRAHIPTSLADAPRRRCNDDPMGLHDAHNIGFAVSSNSDVEASLAHSTPRTLSSLLPDKPTYGLYPEPLRLSRQKRPGSVGTLFEEDVTKPRSFIGSPRLLQNPSSWSRKPQPTRPHNQPPVAGLPAHPRAMLHGFRDGQDGKLALRGPNRYRRRDYENPMDSTSCSNDVPGPSHHISPEWNDEDDDDGHWLDSESGYPRPTRSSPYLDDNPDGGRHLIYDAEGSASHPTFSDAPHNPRRESRHSGSLRPLTPVREIRTPNLEIPNWQYETPTGSRIPVGLPRTPLSRSISPAQEIVSRPRIVRQDDIRKVQIRRVTPEPDEEQIGSYYAHGGVGESWSSGDAYSSIQYGAQARRTSFDSVSSSGRMKGPPVPRKPLPIERSLTPSRQGSDLILRVD